MLMYEIITRKHKVTLEFICNIRLYFNMHFNKSDSKELCSLLIDLLPKLYRKGS